MFSFIGLFACTGLQLIGEDGTVVRGRTNEWGAFNMHSNATIYPRQTEFTGTTPEGANGLKWQAKYGFVCFEASEGIAMDGMNEAGLSIGGFLHKGFADYPAYDPKYASESISPGDLLYFVLSNFDSIETLKKEIGKIRIVPVKDPVIGMEWQAHCFVSDQTGANVVIEFTHKEMTLYDNPVGVITNNPNFDWHLINLRNYGYISDTPFENKKWGELEISPLAAGSGMLGLPGDFTSPSRFVRAVVFKQFSRKTKGGYDTVQELFRILDNFNVAPHLAEASSMSAEDQMPSATQWTIANDTKNLIIYYHTMYNRRVRKIEMKKLDFENSEVKRIPIDVSTTEDILDITGKF
jgi:choloylglycine hydrolase